MNNKMSALSLGLAPSKTSEPLMEKDKLTVTQWKATGKRCILGQMEKNVMSVYSDSLNVDSWYKAHLCIFHEAFSLPFAVFGFCL